jgi:ribosome-binding ATPase
MGFSCGFVGMPNVGKSTLFNALTTGKADAANFPFCTIEPNTGMVAVPDARLEKLGELHNSKKVVPAIMKFIDIAGLVKGASQGQGLGNQFLGHIRKVDAIAHVVRLFNDDDITHVSGKLDPVNDVELITTELILADLEVVEKRIARIGKKARTGDKDSKKELTICEELLSSLSDGKKPVINYDEDDEFKRKIIKEVGLICMMPAFICANIGEDRITDYAEDENYIRLKAYADEHGMEVIPVSAQIEEEISQLDADETISFMEELGIKESGLEKIIKTGYELLNYITFLTTGPTETRAWTVTAGATAPQAASKIHTDMERGFIRMEVTAYDDIITYGSEAEAKRAGKMRVEGKDYIVNDGDVVHVRFSV